MKSTTNGRLDKQPRRRNAAVLQRPSDRTASEPAEAPELLSFLHDTSWDELPELVRRQAVRCLLDTLGAAVAGRSTRLSAIVHETAVDVFGGRGSRLWRDGREVSPPGAALANGMTIDSMDIHDGHSLTKGHAGAAVVPAIIAVAEQRRGEISGAELLTSLAIGYEVALRDGIALHGTACDYHTSGAWNALGCAAAAARLWRMSSEQTMHALGIAEYHGPRSQMMRCVDHPTMLKDGSGWGAMAGVTAAMLARRGFTGWPAATIVSADARPYWESLGSSWEFLNVYFKPHAVCRWAQPAVEAALQLRAAHCFDPTQVARIEVRTFHEAVRLSVRRPRTTEEAQYSLPFAVAAALVHGRLGPQELDQGGLEDSRALDLSDKLTPIEAPDHSRAFPARRLADVAVELLDGRRFEVRAVGPRWDGVAPPNDAELLAKFQELVRPLGEARADRLAQLALNCADAPNLAPLFDELAAR